MVSSPLDPSLTDVPDSLPLDLVALDEVLREFYPYDNAVGYINADGTSEELNENPSDLHSLWRSRAVDGARVDKPPLKKVCDTSSPMSVRVSLDCRYEYAVVVRAEGIGIVPVVGGEAGSFLFTEADATGLAKTVVVIRRLGRKTGCRTVMTSNSEAGDF
eukprot:IDg4106t1